MKPSDARRVVVTGMGVACPLGVGLSAFEESIFAGRSGISRWKTMDPRIESKIGGDMSHFDLPTLVESAPVQSAPDHFLKPLKKLLRETPLSTRLATVAALEAFCHAGCDSADMPRERFGHVVGGHNLTTRYFVDNAEQLREDPDFIAPLFGLHCLDTDVAAVPCELLGLRGPTFTVGGACASGNIGLMTGFDLLRSGRADACLVTGGPSDCDPITLQGWAMVEALSFQNFNDEPERASRPFGLGREGFVPAHGTGSVVIETLESAEQRGATIYAEILGASCVSSATRLPKPDRVGQVSAIELAMEQAGVEAKQIDYVNAHATSTPLGDAVEVSAIKEALGDRAYEIPVNSTKSMLGHCLSAAGAVEFVATLLQIHRKRVHPTINQDTPDPELDLDFVAGGSRDHSIGVAISNSFGFGGINSCVVVSKP